MIYEANSYKEYLDMLPEDRKAAIEKLRSVVKENLPDGFGEGFKDGFVYFSVPHSIYPSGYHVNPEEPLPFIAIASQKNFIAFYHMGIYSFDDILKWFQLEYPKYVSTKLDMGKSCIRFKNINKIPFELIGELCRKITVAAWVEKYEESIPVW